MYESIRFQVDVQTYVCVRMYASVCMDMLRKLFVNSSP